MLAQPHRRRRDAARGHRQPQLRQSRAAGDHGPAGRRRSRASARPAARSTSRSCRATCRSTTRPTARRSCPRPRSAASGCSPTGDRSATLAFKAAGEAILLVGAPAAWGTHLGQSIYLREIFGREDGAPPPVDLAAEKRNGDFVRVADRGRQGDGGARPLRWRARRGDRRDGAGRWHRRELDSPATATPAAAWFGEDQGRYVVTVPAGAVDGLCAEAEKAGAGAARIGTVGGDAIRVGGAAAIGLDSLRTAHERWLPNYMDGH